MTATQLTIIEPDAQALAEANELTLIAAIEQRYQVLAQVTDPVAALAERDRGMALKECLKRKGASLEAQNAVAAYTVWSEYTAGRLYAEMPKNEGAKGNPGGQGARIVRFQGETAHPTLADLGISKADAHRLLAAAELDQDEVTDYIQTTTTTGHDEVSLAGLRKRGSAKRKTRIRREKQQQRCQTATPAPSNILTGDFRVVGQQVADGSVDLIVTDPPYDEASVPLYGDLAQFAARVLRPGGLCLAYSGQMHLPQIYTLMSAQLDYLWTGAVRHTGGLQRIFKPNVNTGWKPVLIYVKPPLEVWWDSFPDITSGGREKDDHDWQQAEAEAAHFLTALGVPGFLVVDPFCGSGTVLHAAKALGLRYIGIEQDPETAERARARVEGAV